MSFLNIFKSKDNLVGSKVPKLPDNIGPWLNTSPINIKEASKAGKIVLIDFWTYTCVNCLRTLPFLKHLFKKYARFGLIIIGVHTPEFDFEKEQRHVENFLKNQNIKYPVILDPEYRIWNAFANHGWPRKLLVDTKGKICFDHLGEGAYVETEQKIREALQKAYPDKKLPKMITKEHKHVGTDGTCYPQTPEVYCGYLRGTLGNPEGFKKDTFNIYKLGVIKNYIDGSIYLNGAWIATQNFLQHAVNTKDPLNYVTLPFHGLELNGVIKLDETKSVKMTDTAKVYVDLDDQPITEEFAGIDIQYDKAGRSFIDIQEPRMYNLYRSNIYGYHKVKITPLSYAFQIYAFTFGGCVE